MAKIADIIRQDILAGRFSGSNRLPGVRELAIRYHCSRGTVSNALKELSEQGVVQTEHGRGIFLTGAGRSKQQNSGRLVGAVLLWNSWLEEMERIREEYLNKGWFVSVYCSSDDMQNPEAERRFLELAAEQKFAGVILTGTPLQPLNTELYQILRRSGMKLIHLTYYKEDMSGEQAVLPDYRMAGAMACSAAAAQGKKKFIIVRGAGYTPPSTVLRNQGIRVIADSLGMKEYPELFAGEMGDPLVYGEVFRQYFRQIGDLTEVSVFSDSAFLLWKVREWMLLEGIPEQKLPFFISTSDTCPSAKNINHISFDYEKSIRMAMDYIMDETILPLEPWQRFLNPELHLLRDSQNDL